MWVKFSKELVSSGRNSCQLRKIKFFVFLLQNRYFLAKNIQNYPYLSSICVECEIFEFGVREN